MVGAATLADHDYVWCAWCLDRFGHSDDSDALRLPLLPVDPLSHEEHHPFPKHTFRQHVRPLFPVNFPLGWTVPMHRKCHDECHSDAESVDSYLRAALRLESLDARDRWAANRHGEGLYWLSMILNADTYRRFEPSYEPSGRALLVERQLSSGSGTTSRIHPVGPKEIQAVVPRTHRTQVLNHLANRRANRGHAKAARRTLKEVERFSQYVPPESKDSVSLSSLFRRAQVSRESGHTKEAVTIARDVLGDRAYSYLTGLVLHGWNSLCDERASALDPFLEVLTHVVWAPWL